MLAKRLALALALLLAPAVKAYSNQDEMQPMVLNGYQLIDAEYWPFMGDTPFQFPRDILWGFYNDGASAAARDCALEAYRQLKGLFETNPPSLRRVVALGGTPRFYLWVSDYTAASVERPVRLARLWHYTSVSSTGPSDYTKGSWQWEAVVSQAGVCTLPKDEETEATLQKAVKALGG